MPISVLCPGCKAIFKVSEKFAGQKGPCPKCKATITIPKETSPVEEVKIHVPEEFASGGKDSKGRPATKPIPRKVAKIAPLVIVSAIGGVIMVFLGALASGSLLEGTAKLGVAIGGLAVLSPLLAAAGYSFLREQELEPYRGKSLWIRASICGLVYMALWGIYWIVAAQDLLSGEPYVWFFVGPAFIAVGGLAGLAALDLDYTNGALLYCFYLAATIALRAAMGFPHL